MCLSSRDPSILFSKCCPLFICTFVFCVICSSVFSHSTQLLILLWGTSGLQSSDSVLHVIIVMATCRLHHLIQYYIVAGYYYCYGNLWTPSSDSVLYVADYYYCYGKLSSKIWFDIIYVVMANFLILQFEPILCVVVHGNFNI